jgi:hypothetical protein
MEPGTNPDWCRLLWHPTTLRDWIVIFMYLNYCETAGLTFNEVIDSNRMYQMDVFQVLGLPYIPIDYIRHNRPRGMVKYRDKID